MWPALGAVEGFDESERWEALATIQQTYLGILDSLQLWDRQTARLIAIQHRECHFQGQIVLLGMADMNQTLRKMLDQVADQVPPRWCTPRPNGPIDSTNTDAWFPRRGRTYQSTCRPIRCAG